MLSFNQSSPSYDIVCPGDTLVFTCITSYISKSVTWKVNGILYILINDDTLLLPSDFTIAIITEINNTTSTITSTATNVSAPLLLNGTDIDCSGDGLYFSNTTVHIAGKIHSESYVT